MRSPADMEIIQIDITNACNKACSNCTRFCGNHRKAFFMDFDTFKRAADSLCDFTGITGIMGGEPTLHPEFERFARYLRSIYGDRTEDNRMVYPQREFIKEVRRREFESRKLYDNGDFKMHGPGLWSNMGSTYAGYYELIQDCFNVQFLNDHINPSYHQPGLFSRRDLGISDEEWIPMRDRCWIQNQWSATITPKGAFFCEIAGALDMLFDGPGGWKIEPGWWKRAPEEFGDQLHWCEICGFALETFMRDAEDEMDDVSPTLYEKLKAVRSPRLERGKTNPVKIVDGKIVDQDESVIRGFSDISASQPYIEHYEDRFNEYNSVLFVQSYEALYLKAGKDFGSSLNRVLQKAGKNGWILLKEAEETDISEIDEWISRYIFNPGTLHHGQGFWFFNSGALSLRRFGFDGIAHAGSFDEIVEAWQPDKVIELEDTITHTRWKRESIIPEKRYVIWGTGLSGSFIYDMITGSGSEVVFAVDRDENKKGKPFFDVDIHDTGYLRGREKDYDLLAVAHYSEYKEIKEQALALGVPKDRIIMPYEI